MTWLSRKSDESPEVDSSLFVERRAEETVNVLEKAQEEPSLESRVPERIVDASLQHSYEELSTLLGFDPAELTRAQLLAFFEEHNIALYDYGQVEARLTKKKDEAGKKHWCWQAFREEDIVKKFRWGFQDSTPTDGYYSGKKWECRPYERLIPRHALEKVALIREHFGERVKFFVSDLSQQTPTRSLWFVRRCAIPAYPTNTTSSSTRGMSPASAKHRSSRRNS